MERARSKSIDVGFMRPNLLNIKHLARSSRKSFDAGSLGPNLLVPGSLDTGNRYGGSRKSIDVGRVRRPSRVSADVGSRRNLSYDAWIRAIRVS